jgi:hypothetical protein
MVWSLFFKISLALLFIQSSADTCDDKKSNIGECKIKNHVCKHWNGGGQYSSESKDENDGIEAGSDGHHHDSETAVLYSMKNLFDKLGVKGYDEYTCNCEKQDTQQETCNLRTIVCFNFKSRDDIKKKKEAYEATAYDMNDNSRHRKATVGLEYSNATTAGQAAVDKLFDEYPETAMSCGVGQGSVIRSVKVALPIVKA